MYHALKADGRSLIVPAPKTQDKDFIRSAIRHIFEIEQVIRYVQIGEAWTLSDSATPEEIFETAKQGGLSKHPKRVEIVLLLGEDHQEGFVMAQREIIRGRGKKPRLGPLEFRQFNGVEGRMVGLLPTPE